MSKPTYQLAPISESTNFKPVNITSISSATPNLIHTSDSVNYDELWLSAYNYSSTDSLLYLCLGGTNTHEVIPIPVPSGVGLVPILNGLVFTGGVEISAYSSSANSVSVYGRVNKIVFI